MGHGLPDAEPRAADTQFPKVDSPTPNSRAAAETDFPCSNTYATARSRNSTENERF